MIFIIFWFLGLAVGIITSIINPAINTIESISSNLLLYQLVITMTLTGICGFLGHVFKSDKIAVQIGWSKGSLFQKELGFAELGYGIAGLLCIWFRGYFWLATIVIVSPLYLGAAIVHIKEMIKSKNFKPGNSISVVPDLLIPISLFVLYFLAN